MERVSSKIAKKRAALVTEKQLAQLLMSASPLQRDVKNAKADVERAKQEKETDAMIKGLTSLYNDCEGDVEAIFACLNEDPGKAIRYPPSSALEFATKYLAGGYTYVEVRKQPSKLRLATAVAEVMPEKEEMPMLAALEKLYNDNVGDIRKIFEILDEAPEKALKYPPSGANDFAQKYINGNYENALNAKQRATFTDSKDVASAASKPAASTNPMLAGLEQLYNAHSGDLSAIFAALGEDPSKAKKYPPPNASTVRDK